MSRESRRKNKRRAKWQADNAAYKKALGSNPANNRAPKNSGGTAAKRGKVRKYFEDLDKI